MKQLYNIGSYLYFSNRVPFCNSPTRFSGTLTMSEHVCSPTVATAAPCHILNIRSCEVSGVRLLHSIIGGSTSSESTSSCSGRCLRLFSFVFSFVFTSGNSKVIFVTPLPNVTWWIISTLSSAHPSLLGLNSTSIRELLPWDASVSAKIGIIMVLSIYNGNKRFGTPENDES